MTALFSLVMSPTIASSSARVARSSQVVSVSSRLLTVAVSAASGVLSSWDTDESSEDLSRSASRCASARAISFCSARSRASRSL